MSKIGDFLRETGVFFLATTDGVFGKIEIEQKGAKM